MAADEEQVRLRDRQGDLAAAQSARRLQRQEDARRLIEEANAMTRRGVEDDDDGEEGAEA